jgi:low temperature requirement protein LtrA
MMLAAHTNHLRVRHGHSRVTFVELFFDLVFVFAVTQLSHGLLEHLTPLGALQTAVLMLALWWAWIDNRMGHELARSGARAGAASCCSS